LLSGPDAEQYLRRADRQLQRLQNTPHLPQLSTSGSRAQNGVAHSEPGSLQRQQQPQQQQQRYAGNESEVHAAATVASGSADGRGDGPGTVGVEQQEQAVRHHVQQHTTSVGSGSRTFTEQPSSGSTPLPSIGGEGSASQSRFRGPVEAAPLPASESNAAATPPGECSNHCSNVTRKADSPPPLRRRKSTTILAPADMKIENLAASNSTATAKWLSKQQEKEDALKVMLECSICLDVMIDPVTLACGHNFCKSCLQALILHSSEEAFNCPIDRYRFPRSYPLRTSITLQAILEMFDPQSIAV
jgi:hypothetical protein